VFCNVSSNADASCVVRAEVAVEVVAAVVWLAGRVKARGADARASHENPIFLAAQCNAQQQIVNDIIM
jgi:hypothetical protein